MFEQKAEVELRATPLDVELRAEGDGPRSVRWYAALFDALSEDLGGFRERIGRRAFTATLAEREVRALINHDRNLILSRTGNGTLKLDVDLKGLQAESALPETSYARDLLVNLGNGNITGGSFAFVSLRDDWALEDVAGVETLVRTIKEARLYDVSLVAFPAYPATEGSASLRSLAESWRERLEPRRGRGLLRRRLDLARIKMA